ncbi:MAG TPA: cupredoxin domain-containing protein [Phenylobacterium sp.]
MRAAVLPLFMIAGLVAPAMAAEPTMQVVVLTLKDHRFTPAKLIVPAGQRIRIELINEDAALEEFDSVDLGVEKDVTPHGRASFSVGPLKPGTYSFMGELHADTASGELQAVEPPAAR